MMQQELCYQPNFGKVTALSISRRVVAVTIRIRVFCISPQKVQSGISSRLENDPLPHLSILTTICMSMRSKLDGGHT